VKKYLALFLIVIMAVSVLSAAGVVTTQKAAAQSSPPAVAVTYKKGATYIYAPWQFNNKYADFYAYSRANIKHSETTSIGTAFSSIRTTQTQAGEGDAGVGMYWKLNIPSGATWATIKNMPCKVTVTASYYIEAKGNNATYADVYWGQYHTGYGYASVNGTSPHESALTTKTFYGTVGDVFSGGSVGPHYGGAGAQVDTGQYPAGAGQASGAIVCYSVVLTFPQASG